MSKKRKVKNIWEEIDREKVRKGTNLIVNTMVVLHEEGGSGAHAKFTGLPCFTLLRRNSGNRFHQK